MLLQIPYLSAFQSHARSAKLRRFRLSSPTALRPWGFGPSPLYPVTLKYPALTGVANPTLPTNAARSKPSVCPTCVLDTENPTAVSYNRLTYRCGCGGVSAGGPGAVYEMGPLAPLGGVRM